MDLTSKADEVRGKMANRKEKVRDISLLLGNYLTELNAIKEKVNKETSENLDKVDEARELLHKRKQDLHQRVQKETEVLKMELIRVQKLNLEQLKDTTEEIQQCKAQLDSFYVDVEKSINCLPHNVVVQNDGNTAKVFRDLSRKEILRKNFNVVIQDHKYEQPNLPAQLQMLEAGNIHQIETKVQAPNQQLAEITKMKGNANEVKRINQELLKSEKTNFHEFYDMCLSKDGAIIMSGVKPNEDNCCLKCIRNGVNLWEVSTDHKDVCLLCCVNRKKEYLIKSNVFGRRLEVRDVTDGRLLHGCDVDFNPRVMCSTDNGFVLVENNSVIPRTLVKFKLTEHEGVKLENTYVTINTQIEYQNGLTVLSCDDKKLVILNRYRINIMQAINYETGAVEWEIEK